MEEQYWISPRGEIIPIAEHPVRTMVKEPAQFGYKIDEMQMIYAKYSDANQEEGEATKAIIEDLLKKGWSYCHRKKAKPDWRIEVHRLDKKTRNNLRIWSAKLIETKQIDMESLIKIYRSLKKDKLSKSIKQLMEDDLFSG